MSSPAQAPQQQSSDGGDTIPNFLVLDQIPANYSQQVETDLLEPVVFQQGTETTDGFSRFTLQNKGFLHSHSKIFVALDPQAGITNGFLQPHVGIGQIIKRAVLKIGNKTLNELDSWAGLHAVKSSLISNENQLERELYMTGRYMNHKFKYNAGSRVFADKFGLDAGVEGSATEDTLPTWALMDTAKKAECPSFMIDLSDLFPFLKVNQLPLYMIDEPINIELTFQPTRDKRVQLSAGDTGGSACLIDRNELKFCADYIYYGASDEMERYAAANQDMSFSFVDYRLVENSTSDAALASGVIRNLGMANRIVPRVIATLPDTAASSDTLLGENNSIAPTVNASGVQTGYKFNVRYNDRYEFTTDVSSTARQFSIMTQSEGVPFVARQEFSNQGKAGGVTTTTWQGRDQDASLGGKFFNMGTALTNGRVGQRGIELHISGAFTGPDLVRCYCEYVRVARLSGGMFDLYNA